MRRALGALLAAAALAGCGIDLDDDQEPPGSTLRATIVDTDGNGELGGGGGRRMVERTDLAPRGNAPREAARIGHLTDTHVRDEESPARVPFLDRLGDPVTSTFRPHEALSTQVLAAAVRAFNTEAPQGVILSGDLIDSAQRNELFVFSDVIRGGRIEPDSGGEGYRGVQQASNPDGQFYRPALDAPRIPSLLARAQRPFVSPGLRAPWWPAVGNHDLMVQGELPPSPATRAIATGDEMVQTFDPSLADRLEGIEGSGGGDSPDLRDIPRAEIEELLGRGLPGPTVRVPADPERAHREPAAMVRQFRMWSQVSGDGDRLNYNVDVSPGLRLVVLDSVDRAGGARGAITATEVTFLRSQLANAGDRAIVVVSHHGLHRARGGDRALRLLGRDANVVAELHGDTHRHEIRPVRTSAGGFWRISTSSLADWPQQGRMLRLVTGPNGDRAIETWVVDHTGGPGGADLPGAARRLSYLDAQGGRPQRFAGTPADRNARLWLPRRAG